MLLKAINVFKRNWGQRGVVLCYHRIAEPKTDPWGIAVCQKVFEEQIRFLKDEYNLVAVPTLIEQLQDNKLQPKTVCITFDDGYTDNYLYAKPILEKYNVPATLFITSRYYEQEESYWWDDLELIFLNSQKLPASLSVTVNNQRYDYDNTLGTDLTGEQREMLAKWRAKFVAPSRRAELYLALWSILRPLPPSEINSVMNQLREWSKFNRSVLCKESLPMAKPLLKELADNSLFTIGMHTYSHTSLAHRPYQVQKEEIVKNRMDLQVLLNREIDFLSFPYGSYNTDTLRIVIEQNIKAAFTTKREVTTRNSCTSEIGRFNVQNWNVAAFRKKLNQWFLAQKNKKD